VVDGRLAVTPVGQQGSHMIGDLAESDSLIVVAESVTSVAAGETVTVLPLDEDF
jgi:molybdopterin molybdotransferase